MLTTPHLQTRSRTRLVAAASGLLAAALAAGAASPPASAGSVDAPIYDGVNRFEVAIPHVPGVRLPLIRYRTIPAGADCRLTRLSYVARADEPDERPAGRAALTVRCGNIAPGARVRLDAGPPLVRRAAIHNGDGRLEVRLDKPPGAVSPQVLLETTPRGRGSCVARSLDERETATVLAIRGRFRCSRLARNARAVLSVGGVVAASPAAEDAAGGRAPSNARASASGDCGSVVQQPKSATELEMSQKLCLKPTQIVTIARYSLGLGSPAATSCPVGWLNTANPWPGFTFEVTPTDGWWSAGKDAFGDWRFSNGSPDLERTLVLKWSCWLAAPGNTALPAVAGDARVGGTLRCNPGTWSSPEVADFEYAWVSRRGAGTTLIASGDTYTLTPAQKGQSVACLVTPYTATGSALQPSVFSPTSDPVVDAPPRVLTPPTITRPRGFGGAIGIMVTCNPGTWDQARPKDPFTYQWLINGAAMPGETGQQLRMPNRLGDRLSCNVTAHNVLGTVLASSDALTIGPPSD